MAGGRALLDSVSVEIRPGTLHAVLGPNGAGKSTLLRSLSGEREPDAGEIRLNGKRLQDWSARERARQRAVLPQADNLRFGFTAEQVVTLGRMPCPQHEAARERDIVASALEACGARGFAQRRYPTLSGGERARVQLARVLAQIWEPLAFGPRYLLLDEPTAALDLSHQHSVMAMARRFAREQGIGVLAVLHDPNLALGYADEVTLLRAGRVLASGPPTATMTAARLAALYDIEVEVLEMPGRRPWVVPKAHGPDAGINPGT